MKKLSLFIVAILFAVACSTDNQETNVNDANTVTVSTKREGVDLERMYQDMINSASYLAFKDASGTFARKMNFDGALSDIDTDAKILSWISNNIAKTSFANFEAAEREFETVQVLSRTAVDDNMAFYRALDGETPERIIEVIGSPEPPIVSTGCPTCIKDFNSSMVSITGQFVGHVMVALASVPTEGGAAASIKLASAQLAFSVAAEHLAQEFIKCCIG